MARGVRPERISAIAKVLENEGLPVSHIEIRPDGSAYLTLHDRDTTADKARQALLKRRERKANQALNGGK